MAVWKKRNGSFERWWQELYCYRSKTQCYLVCAPTCLSPYLRLFIIPTGFLRSSSGHLFVHSEHHHESHLIRLRASTFILCYNAVFFFFSFFFLNLSQNPLSRSRCGSVFHWNDIGLQPGRRGVLLIKGKIDVLLDPILLCHIPLKVSCSPA